MRTAAVFIATIALLGAAVGIKRWALPTEQRHGVVVETVERASVEERAGNKDWGSPTRLVVPRYKATN
jgi:hypothetical protein